MKQFFPLILLAVFIRLLIMPFYLHPDIKTYHYQASFLRKGVLNIYDYLPRNKERLPLKEEFIYFPLTYFVLGGYQILASPFLGGEFQQWLANPNVQTYPQEVGVFRYLFILKLPYLVLDILMGILLFNFFKEAEKKKKALILWLFNPFSIVLLYVYSNLDIIPTVLTMASLLLILKKQFLPATLMLVLGAGFKAYPSIFIPVVFFATDNLSQKIKMVLTTIFGMALINGPFLASEGFRNATVASGLTTRLILPGINLNFGESLMMGILALSAVIFYLFSKGKIEANKVWVYWTCFLLIIFSFSHYHIQWLLWVMPFLVIWMVVYPKFTAPIIVLFTIACTVPLSYQDIFMSFGLLAPVSGIFKTLPTPFVVLSKLTDPYVFMSVMHSVLAGGSIALMLSLLTKEAKE